MIQITRYKPMDKGPLKAFLDIYIEPWGLEIRDCSLMETDSGKWVNMPSERYTKDDGSTGYKSYLFFNDPQTRERFQNAVKSAVDEYVAQNAPSTSTQEPELEFWGV